MRRTARPHVEIIKKKTIGALLIVIVILRYLPRGVDASANDVTDAHAAASTYNWAENALFDTTWCNFIVLELTLAYKLAPQFAEPIGCVMNDELQLMTSF